MSATVAGIPKAMINRLLELFEEQVEVHEAILEQIDMSMAALREGRMEAFVESCRRQHGLAQRAEQLESSRQAACRDIAPRLGSSSEELPELDEIRQAAPEGLGQQLDAAARRLRPLVQAARARSAVLRRAVASMARHISGMVQAVHGASQPVGMYERRGMLSRSAQLDYSIDVRS